MSRWKRFWICLTLMAFMVPLTGCAGLKPVGNVVKTVVKAPIKVINRILPP